MAKAKNPRTTRIRSEFILKPSWVRMALIYTLLFALALMVGLLLRFAFSGWQLDAAGLFGDWILNLLIVVGGAIVFAFVDHRRWTIRVLNGERVEGPTGAMGERAALPLKEIDWQRTSRSLTSRVKLGNAIYTLSRQRILISPWFYPPARFQEFLTEIGFQRSNLP